MNARPSVPQPMASEPPNDAEICAYVAELCAELRHLARKPKFRTINYLLDMARLEAERMGKDLRDAALRRES